MNFMYAVVIDNLPAKALHPNLRDHEMEYYCSSGDPITYKKYIGPLGRFSSFKGAAYMDTEQLAERFLLHFRPIMDKRGYQDCPMSIFRFSPGKWDIKRASKVIPKVKAMLGEGGTGI